MHPLVVVEVAPPVPFLSVILVFVRGQISLNLTRFIENFTSKVCIFK